MVEKRHNDEVILEKLESHEKLSIERAIVVNDHLEELNHSTEKAFIEINGIKLERAEEKGKEEGKDEALKAIKGGIQKVSIALIVALVLWGSSMIWSRVDESRTIDQKVEQALLEYGVGVNYE